MDKLKLSIKKVDCKAFTKLVKSLLLIDKFIFLNITKDTVTSSVFLKNKDAVKLAKVDTSSLFTIDIFPVDKLRISFHDSSKLVNALEYFTEAKADINIIEYDGFYYATDFVISDKKLKIKLYCGDPSHKFIEMTSDQTKVAFGTSDCLFKFTLTSESFKEINSLMSLDKDVSIFEFIYVDTKILFKTKAYELVIAEDAKIYGKTSKVTIYKKYLSHMDKDEYDVSICENKVVLKSKTENTLITFALCITDDADINIEDAIEEITNDEI